MGADLTQTHPITAPEPAGNPPNFRQQNIVLAHFSILTPSIASVNIPQCLIENDTEKSELPQRNFIAFENDTQQVKGRK
jgi:hypothetical protein